MLGKAIWRHLRRSAFTLAMLATAFPALADPPQGRVPPQANDWMVGVGSRNVQELMNELATRLTNPFRGGGLPFFDWYNVYGSEEYDGSALIRTRIAGCTQPDSGAVGIPRPRSGSAAVAALLASMATSTPATSTTENCIDFAVVSRWGTDIGSDAASSDYGYPLSYHYWLKDAFTYATLGGSVPQNLSKSELASIYYCQEPGIEPLLPPYGNDIRRAFLLFLGIADSPNFTSELGHTCVREAALMAGEPVTISGTTRPVKEVVADSTGALLTNPNQILPYSVANYIAQSVDVEWDALSNAKKLALGRIDGHRPFLPADLNSASTAISYAIGFDSDVPTNFSSATLKRIYTCEAPLPTNPYLPLLPKQPSQLRTDFLSSIGLTDSPNFVQSYPCVKETDANGAPIRENDGRQLIKFRNLVPYRVAAWVDQKLGIVLDIHGRATLGLQNGLPPILPNPNAPNSYNLSVALPATSGLWRVNYDYLIRGASPLLCTYAASVVRKHGFTLSPLCGNAQ